MKEKDLIEAGMKKRRVSAEESGDAPFYYYSWEPYKLSAFGLISSSNDEDSVKNDGEWSVSLFDDVRIEFKTAEDLKLFIDVVKRNTKKK